MNTFFLILCAVVCSINLIILLIMSSFLLKMAGVLNEMRQIIFAASTKQLPTKPVDPEGQGLVDLSDNALPYGDPRVNS